MTMLADSPGSLRKKRNFKQLQLPTAKPTGSSDGSPVPTRQAPKGPRPPLLDTLSKTSTFASKDEVLSPESSTTQRRNLQATLTSTLEKMDLNHATNGNGSGGKKRLLESQPKPEDFKNLAELGMGNGGSVMKVEHLPTGIIMAKKIVLIDAKPSVRKQILRELHIMHNCDSPFIVSSYGAFLSDPNICICMEFMDKRSFDGIYKRVGAIDIDVVGKVAYSVLEGLLYLYDVHHIIHRDIKPSNILLNSEGEIKLCDFGVSGELINSLANTFVGTSIYMSPERIQGGEYSVKSDVWSLGITIVELAHGRFPFSDADADDNNDSDIPPIPEQHEDETGTLMPPTLPDTNGAALSAPTLRPNRDSLVVPSRASRRRSKGVSLHGGGMTMSILELMHLIVQEPAPRLTASTKDEGRFPLEADEFVDACLNKEIEERKTPRDLLKFSWFGMDRLNKVDLKAWAATF
ncbi:MAP kinase kinase (MEK) [Paramarasmius palmivorus]|uniref:MAP kinase kinase (MEK) n=1 Tax=Paramarasmius palmivorus TaxID=297713 RepID=A0AAW0C1F1_9AGAR